MKWQQTGHLPILELMLDILLIRVKFKRQNARQGK